MLLCEFLFHHIISNGKAGMLHQKIMMLLSILIMNMFIVSSASTEHEPTSSAETYPPYSCYECFASGCNDPYNKTCITGLNCFTHTEIVDGRYLYLEKGCHRVPLVSVIMCNKGIARKKENDTNPVHTCCRGNFCNDDDFEIQRIAETLDATSTSKIKDEQTNKTSLEENVLPKGDNLSFDILIACLITSVTILIMALVYFAAKRVYAPRIKESDFIPKFLLKLHWSQELVDSNWSSGSGSRLPVLNQRSLAQEVNLMNIIGHGRYGAVYHGTLFGEDIAVKIFSSADVASWEHEVNIYASIALYHENVLGFKGSTITARGGVTQMLLLTAYHERGSLYDYLLENTVSLEQMIVFVRTACSGLLHLHTEICGSKGKPAIAHRDLKTRNILISTHGTCVIADFGLALVNSGESAITSCSENYKAGTKRYLAPELLDESINTTNFESFRRTDMYAFGLLMWEICSRCVADGTDESFRLAFHDCVPDNPDFEDMKKVVCTELKRPEIPDKWLSDETFNAMADIMRHCWHKNPEVRYTAHRVKNSLDKIQEKIQNLQSNVDTV